ncbi:hypothetical protein SVIOM342S_09830 [Streptomyces violaceorubidus]
MSDRDFLDRLYPLRGGFRALTPKGRTRVLAAVSDRLGDRPGLRLRAPAELVGRWAAADGEGYALLRDLGLAGLVGASAPAPTGAAPAAAPPTERPAPGPVPGAGAPRIGPADRWRLLLGRDTAQLPAALWPYARALDELFEREGEAAGRGRGETGEDGDGGGGGEPEPGAGGPTGGSDAADDRSGGRGRGYPSVRHWAEDLRALFGADIREEVLGRAVAEGRTDAVDLLDAATARPSVELLSTVLSLARGMPEQRLAGLRPLVERLVEELTRELATRLRPTLTGLTSPLPTRRPRRPARPAPHAAARISPTSAGGRTGGPRSSARTAGVQDPYRAAERLAADPRRRRLRLHGGLRGVVGAHRRGPGRTRALHPLPRLQHPGRRSPGWSPTPLSLLLEVKVGRGTHYAAQWLAHGRLPRRHGGGPGTRPLAPGRRNPGAGARRANEAAEPGVSAPAACAPSPAAAGTPERTAATARPRTRGNSPAWPRSLKSVPTYGAVPPNTATVSK